MRVSLRQFVALGSAAVVAAGLVALGTRDAGAVPIDQYVVATGTGPGGGPHVKVFAAATSQEAAGFFAYDPAFRGGVNVAMGDLDGDGDLEIITGAGPGGGPHVKVFTDHGVPINELGFFAYSTAFKGGVNVGVTDIDGDGDDEIITAPASGGGPHIKVVDVTEEGLTLEREFFAYDTGFLGGVSVDGAYVDSTDKEGIVVGAGPGGGPHVKTFNSNAQVVGSWFAYDPAYRGGVSVTSYLEDDDDVAEIVTGALAGRGHVRSFSVTGNPGDVSFYAYDAATTSGVDIDDIDGALAGPFVIAAWGPGVAPCGNGQSGNECVRADYFQGRDADGAATLIQAVPYPGFNGGIRVATAFGSFDSTPLTTTTSSSTTSSSSTTTSSSTTSSTSTSTTSTSTTSTTAPTSTTSSTLDLGI